MRKILTTILVLMLSISISAQKVSFQTLNIMDDFWKYWEKAEKTDIPTRTKIFREMVINPHKEIYQ